MTILFIDDNETQKELMVNNKKEEAKQTDEQDLTISILKWQSPFCLFDFFFLPPISIRVYLTPFSAFHSNTKSFFSRTSIDTNEQRQ